MQIEIKTPDLGEGVEEAQVVSILVQVGQQVKVDQGIIELETEKAVAEVPSPAAGKVVAIHVKPQDTIATGSLLLTIEGQAEQTPATPQGDQAPQEAPSKQKAPAKQSAAEIARLAHEAQDNGTTGDLEQAKPPAAKPHAAQPPSAVSDTSESPLAQPKAAGPHDATPDMDKPAGPEARRLARELGVDLKTVKGTGKDGRILPQDVQNAANAAPPSAQPAKGQRAAAEAPASTEAADAYGIVRREKLTQIRKSIAQHMARSKASLAHVTNFDDADVTDLEAFRKEQKEQLAPQDAKLTLLPFVVRAVVEGLKAHPLLNAAMDLDAGMIVYKQYHNIGIAVDTPRGLIVPVLRDASCLSILEIARKLAEISEKARTGKFDPADLAGGSFTISNLGSVGGRYSTPIINYPESAVLLLGRSRKEPVAVGDEIQVRLILPMSLSYDHRLIDGAEAARFLNHIKEHLESPAKLLLD